ncbi:MAG TPA: serine protease, partial [Blastocatellia bacterium]|nr:serine protease [Blastocatellia bacterium]
NPVSVQLLVNGGFEGSSSPWVLSTFTWTGTGSFPHSGAGYILFGSSVTSSGTAFQQITIPASPAKSLTFWLNVTSSETTTTTQFDRLFIEVRNTSGTLLGTLATFSNLDKAASGSTYTLRGPFSLTAWAGQTVRIQFRGTTDSSLLTTFRIDDASVQ